MKQKNPFLTAGYAGEDYFCDRRSETARLIAAFENDRNVTLIAPRRYGKTGLIKNALEKMPDGFAGIYLDIFAMEGRGGGWLRGIADFRNVPLASWIQISFHGAIRIGKPHWK